MTLKKEQPVSPDKRMITEEFNQGVSFRIPTLTFRELCRRIGDVPGVLFTKRSRFYWSLESFAAAFTFKDQSFTITTDEWDGAYWVMTKGGKRCPEEMKELRKAVEAGGEERSLILQKISRIMVTMIAR